MTIDPRYQWMDRIEAKAAQLRKQRDEEHEQRSAQQSDGTGGTGWPADLPRVAWRLPEQMARAGIRKGSELHRRLVEVMGDEAPSDRHVRQLVDPGPERLSLEVLAGLCEALDCTPGDLLTRAAPARS